MRQIVHAKLLVAALMVVGLAAASLVAVEPEGPRKSPEPGNSTGESHAIQPPGGNSGVYDEGSTGSLAIGTSNAVPILNTGSRSVGPIYQATMGVTGGVDSSKESDLAGSGFARLSGNSRQAVQRTFWVYEGGSFENTVGTTWVEVNQDARFVFTEVTRNTEFIEIYDSDRSCSIRLYWNVSYCAHPIRISGTHYTVGIGSSRQDMVAIPTRAIWFDCLAALVEVAQPDPYAPGQSRDPAFEHLVDMRLLQTAMTSGDTSVLADVALQFAEAERVLLRPHHDVTAEQLMRYTARSLLRVEIRRRWSVF